MSNFRRQKLQLQQVGWTRLLDDNDKPVEAHLLVDIQDLAFRLGKRALHNRSGTAKLANGSVVVRIKR